MEVFGISNGEKYKRKYDLGVEEQVHMSRNSSVTTEATDYCEGRKRGKPRYEGRTTSSQGGQRLKWHQLQPPSCHMVIQFSLGHFVWQETQPIKAEEALVVRKFFIFIHSRVSTYRSPLNPFRTLKNKSSFSSIWQFLKYIKTVTLYPLGQKLLLPLIFPHMTYIVPSLFTSLSLYMQKVFACQTLVGDNIPRA